MTHGATFHTVMAIIHSHEDHVSTRHDSIERPQPTWQQRRLSTQTRATERVRRTG